MTYSLFKVQVKPVSLMLPGVIWGKSARVTIAETRFSRVVRFSGLGVNQEGGGIINVGARIVREYALVK